MPTTRITISALLTILVIVGSIFAPYKASASSSLMPLSGYAWSSNIGWISFSGSNYGVSEDSNGNLSGYAWSSNIGWISFNSTDGCPESGCTTQPAINTTTGVVTGWANAIAADGNGWDGWIKLGGSWSPSVVFSSNEATGYSWGSDVVGWVSWKGSGYGVIVAPASSCTLPWGGTIDSGQSTTAYQSASVTSPVTCASVSETRTCTNGTLSGSYTNESCMVMVWTNYCTGANDVNGNDWQIWAYDNSTPVNYKYVEPGTVANSCTPAVANGSCSTTHYACSSGTSADNASTSTTWTWSCDGLSGGSSASCSETKTAPVPTFSVDPVDADDGGAGGGAGGTTLTIDTGQSVVLSWSAPAGQTTSCAAVGGFSTGGAISGSVTVTPSVTSTYQITCTGPAGTSAPASVTVTVSQTDVSITAAPSRVQSGASATVGWSASHVNSCTVSGPGVSSTSLTGSRVVTVTSQSTYTIDCKTAGADVIKTAVVNVVPGYSEF